MNDLDGAIVSLTESAEVAARASDEVFVADGYILLANAETFDPEGDPGRRSRAWTHVSLALEHARRSSSPAALSTQVDCLEVVADLAINGDRRSAAAAVAEASGILLDSRLRGFLAGDVGRTFGLFERAARLAQLDGRHTDAVRFFAVATRCGATLARYVTGLGNLGAAARQWGDLSVAVQASCQGLRLAQTLDVAEEGIALGRLAFAARDLGTAYVNTLAVLAQGRISRAGAFSELTADLEREFGNALTHTDATTRARIEHDYRADRGATLLREAFGVDVAEIDALNERLGDATEEELRGYLEEVQRYCAE